MQRKLMIAQSERAEITGEEGSRRANTYVYNATWRRKGSPILSGHGAKPNPSPAEGTAKGGLENSVSKTRI